MARLAALRYYLASARAAGQGPARLNGELTITRIVTGCDCSRRLGYCRTPHRVDTG